MATETNQIEELTGTEYKYGFETQVEAETFEPGLNEDIVRRLGLAITGNVVQFTLDGEQGSAADIARTHCITMHHHAALGQCHLHLRGPGSGAQRTNPAARAGR